MTVNFHKLTPDLMVSNVAESVKFYTQKLGFKLDMVVAENERTIETRLMDAREYVYASVSRDQVFVMFMRKDVYEQDIPELKGSVITASGSFYFDVDNVIELYHDFKTNGVEIIKELGATWYGMREFYIRDCNGYILGFASKEMAA